MPDWQPWRCSLPPPWEQQSAPGPRASPAAGQPQELQLCPNPMLVADVLPGSGRWFVPCHTRRACRSPCSGVASDIPSGLAAARGKISTTEEQRPFRRAQQSPGTLHQPCKREVQSCPRTCREGAPWLLQEPLPAPLPSPVEGWSFFSPYKLSGHFALSAKHREPPVSHKRRPRRVKAWRGALDMGWRLPSANWCGPTGLSRGVLSNHAWRLFFKVEICTGVQWGFRLWRAEGIVAA